MEYPIGFIKVGEKFPHLSHVVGGANNAFTFLLIEEIFDRPEAIWASADGTHFMYATFNDTNVGMMTYPWLASGAVITGTGMSAGSSFPETKNVRYPTPGTVNPTVQLWIVNLTNFSEREQLLLKPPPSLDGQCVIMIFSLTHTSLLN